MQVRPEKGQANQAIVALITNPFGIDSSSVAVVNRLSSRAKVVAVAGMDDEATRLAYH